MIDFMIDIQRDIIGKFVEWKNRSERCPILLKGARQIGKTWTMRKFGKDYFDNIFEINFDMQPEIGEIFEKSKDPQRLIEELQLYTGKKIVIGKTLMIFDEIQSNEYALNSLKYFAELMPELHIIAAGSLLGVAIKHKNMTVPVGKVEILQMYPITFGEFLHTTEPLVWQWLEDNDKVENLPVSVLLKLKERYRQYLICGGMPKAVTRLIEGKFDHIDKELNNIIEMYEADFSKYASSTEVIRIGQIWHSLPSQLAKENKKFVYKAIKTGARAREYEDALFWLQNAGLITMVNCVSKPALPLSAYKDFSSFKIYALDCGLLRCLCKLPAEAFLSESSNFTEAKGAIAENYVLQSILPDLECDPYYWVSSGTAEIDFVTQIGMEIYPIEVKAGTNLSGQSLKSYSEKYSPKLLVRIADTDLSLKDNLLSIPLSLAYKMKRYVKECSRSGDGETHNYMELKR